MNYLEYLTEHVGLAAEKQRKAARVLSDRDWTASMNERTISFAPAPGSSDPEPLVVRADILGFGHEATRQFQWAWSVDGDLPNQEARTSSNALKAFGEKHHFTDFTTAAWNVEPPRSAIGISAIAVAVLNADAYFVAPGENDLFSFFALWSPALALGPVDLREVARAVIDIPENYPHAMHRPAVRSYFNARGLEISEPMGRVVGKTLEGKKIRVIFDDYGRISNLQGDFALPEGVQLAT